MKTVKSLKYTLISENPKYYSDGSPMALEWGPIGKVLMSLFPPMYNSGVIYGERTRLNHFMVNSVLTAHLGLPSFYNRSSIGAVLYAANKEHPTRVPKSMSSLWAHEDLIFNTDIDGDIINTKSTDTISFGCLAGILIHEPDCTVDIVKITRIDTTYEYTEFYSRYFRFCDSTQAQLETQERVSLALKQDVLEASQVICDEYVLPYLECAKSSRRLLEALVESLQAVIAKKDANALDARIAKEAAEAVHYSDLYKRQ